MTAPHAEPRPEPRKRIVEVGQPPHVDIAHSAAAGELAITVHVTVPDGYVVPAGLEAELSASVARAIEAATAQAIEDELAKQEA